jgi:hypothetical protein
MFGLGIHHHLSCYCHHIIIATVVILPSLTPVIDVYVWYRWTLCPEGATTKMTGAMRDDAGTV